MASDDSWQYTVGKQRAYKFIKNSTKIDVARMNKRQYSINATQGDLLNGGDFASCVAMTQKQFDDRYKVFKRAIGMTTLYIH